MTQKKLRKRFETEDLIRDIVPFKKEMLDNTFLYKFQKDLLDKASHNWLYRTDTGTGKTFVALHHFLRETENRKKLYIVCPKSKLKELGWDYEIRKMELHYNIKINYETVTYGKLRGLGVAPKKWEDVFVIIDECHNVKNFTSLQGKGAYLLTQQCAGFVLLSATPVPQGYNDMFNYLAMFGTMSHNDYWKFRKAYGIFRPVKNRYTHQYYDVLDGFRESGEKILKEMFTSFSSYPLKKNECLDLPDLVVQSVVFPKSSEYKVLEKAGKELLKYEKNKDFDEDVFESISSLTSFKIKESRTFTKLDTGVGLDYVTSIAKLSYAMRLYSNLSDKLEWISDFVNDTSNNIIVFYNYNAELKMLKDMLSAHEKKNDFDVYTVDTLKDTKTMSEDTRQKVILVQIMKGGAALNLQYCNEVIYMSPDYKYGQYEQSLGRAYRNGQKNKVTVYHLKAEGTIDVRIYNVLSDRAYVSSDIENFGADDARRMETVSDYLFL